MSKMLSQRRREIERISFKTAIATSVLLAISIVWYLSL
jgi:hypothetical protein